MAKRKGTPFLRGRRKCIFCGGFGVNKEHVFGKWLKPYFPRDEHSTHTFGTVGPSAIWGIPKIKENVRQGHVGTSKVKVACKNCNGGWLGTMEETVKPILIPLFTCERTNLSPEHQKILATWVSKTAMTSEYANPREDGISQEEREWLMNKLEPPPHWVVWIANYSGGDWSELGAIQNRGNLQASPISGPNVIKYYVHATTFGMGRVVFLVVGSTWEAIPEIFGGLEGRGMLRLWPPIPRSILWPPFEAVGDPQVNAMANILTESGRFDNSLNPLAKWTYAM